MLGIKVVGCGDAFGSGGQRNTCFYIKGDDHQFLLDCGASSLPALKSYGINPQNLDAVILTHFHGDHFGGLPFILLELSVMGQHKPLKVISPPGARQKIGQLLELLYPGTPVLEKLDITFLEYQAHIPLLADNLRIEAFPMIHTAAALPHGLRITFQDKVISYSGDTEWTDELIRLADGANIFICECNFYDTVAGGHLNYLQLEGKLPLLSAKQIYLTHLDSEMLLKAGALALPVLTDGMLLEI